MKVLMFSFSMTKVTRNEVNQSILQRLREELMTMLDRDDVKEEKLQVIGTIFLKIGSQTRIFTEFA